MADEWAQATEGKRKARRRVLCPDRDKDGRYFHIVFFDSYEKGDGELGPTRDRSAIQELMSFADGPTTSTSSTIRSNPGRIISRPDRAYEPKPLRRRVFYAPNRQAGRRGTSR